MWGSGWDEERVKVAKNEKSHGWLAIAAIFVGEREQSLKRVKNIEVGKWECGGGWGVGYGRVVFQVWI